MNATIEHPFDQLEPDDPGWDVDELLDLADDDLAGPRDTMLAIKAVFKAEAMLHAKRLQLLEQLRASKATDEDGEWTADLVAAELNISIRRAQNDVGFAGLLTDQLPRTLAYLSAGHLDLVRVRKISDLATGLTPDQKHELEERIYPQACDVTPRQLTMLVKRQIIAINPDAAAQQAKAARTDRRVCIEPADHGMGWLNAYLPAEDVEAVYNRIDGLARQVRGADDPRTMDQARADVLRDLILGKDGTGGGTVTHVYVTATAETLLGLSDLPGDLRGYGPLPAEQIRDLAYQLNAVWSGVLVDDHGYPKKLADKRYRFHGKLAEFIRLRGPTCYFPGCNTPAHKCDIDHVTPYPDGETTADNGATACRRHHRLKTETEWNVQRTTDGTITWNGPGGKTLSHKPEPLAPPGDDKPPY